MSSHGRRTATLQERDKKAVEQARMQGFTDGKAGRPARRLEIEYQRAWKRGREAAIRDGGNI